MAPAELRDAGRSGRVEGPRRSCASEQVREQGKPGWDHPTQNPPFPVGTSLLSVMAAEPEETGEAEGWMRPFPGPTSLRCSAARCQVTH